MVAKWLQILHEAGLGKTPKPLIFLVDPRGIEPLTS